MCIQLDQIQLRNWCKDMKNVWEEIHARGELLKIEPHPGLGRIIELFQNNNIGRVLDLGSGGGRNSAPLAAKGLDVYALDPSPTGLAYTLKTLAEKGLTAHLTLHDMSTLPYENDYFDAIISVQVIHHNKLEDIRNTIREITRVLRPGGLIWVTMPVSKYEPNTRQEEIEPGTFLPLDGLEKGLLHHYFKMNEIPPLFCGYSIIDLHIDQTNHFSLIARKR